MRLQLKMRIKGMEKAEPFVQNKMRRVLQKTMIRLEELVILLAPVFQGEIRQKVTLFPQLLADKYVLTSGAKHSEAMEFGTRPFFAPIGPLKDWARIKLGNENLAYPIRAKIAEVGVQAQPYMRPAKIRVETFEFPRIVREEASSDL